MDDILNRTDIAFQYLVYITLSNDRRYTIFLTPCHRCIEAREQIVHILIDRVLILRFVGFGRDKELTV